MNPSAYVRQLSHDYERIHTAKEDAFWTAYMGLADDADAAQAELNRLEIELKRFLQSPERLSEVKAVRAGAVDADERTRLALDGWVRTLEANAIANAEARALGEDLVQREGDLGRARGSMKLGYHDAEGTFHEASSNKLAVMIRADANEEMRRAGWEGLRSIEPFVLENGFVELVRERNRLAHMEGAEDYYDWKVQRFEGMRKSEIFAILDELDDYTRDRSAAALREIERERGDLQPWNLPWYMAGDTTKELDPYYPFGEAVERWGRSFAALGIEYRNADMVLDLVDRKGKYENGFMHGPVPAWRDEGALRPARIQFTANAIPGMVGAGERATKTLFHEGGHAAHFANIDMPAPCFAQEFAPTSVSFAETQSMFLDSILTDADWRTRYAKTVDGESMPFALIEKSVRTTQPFAAFSLRSMFVVPYCERAIYEIPAAELSADRIIATVRETEKRILGVESPRPVLSIPHLLSGEASAYYHGYVLALVAVAQTRRYFTKRDGHLLDNPKIGPDLARAYWRPGNSRTFFQFVQDLTGEPLSAKHLAARVNRTADEAVTQAKAQVARLSDIPQHTGPIELKTRIRIAHGKESIADTSTAGGFKNAAERFGLWVAQRS